MIKKKIFRYLFSTVVFSVILITMSALINALWFGEIHDAHDFFRPSEDIRVTPGLTITTLIWGILLTFAYIKMNRIFKVKNNFLRGSVFGLFVFMAFVLCHEVYYYQFIKFHYLILVGGLLHYFLTLIIGCGFIGVINKNYAD